MKEEKIKFSQLSIWLKLGIIGGLVSLVIWVLSFVAGFFAGAMEMV